eukprot:761937-Hanusia_phi.AAC.8
MDSDEDEYFDTNLSDNDDEGPEEVQRAEIPGDETKSSSMFHSVTIAKNPKTKQEVTDTYFNRSLRTIYNIYRDRIKYSARDMFGIILFDTEERSDKCENSLKAAETER